MNGKQNRSNEERNGIDGLLLFNVVLALSMLFAVVAFITIIGIAIFPPLCFFLFITKSITEFLSICCAHPTAAGTVLQRSIHRVNGGLLH